MDEKSIWLVVISAVLGLLARVVFDWLSRGQRKTDTTGEKDPEYWLEHLNEIKDILKARNVVFTQIEAKLTSLKESTGRIEGRVDEALRLRRR